MVVRLKQRWQTVWQSRPSLWPHPLDDAPALIAIGAIISLLVAGTKTFDTLVPASSIPRIGTDFAAVVPAGIDAGVDIGRRYAFGMAALLLLLTGAVAIAASWHFCAWALSGRQRLCLIGLFAVLAIFILCFREASPNGVRQALFDEPIEAAFDQAEDDGATSTSVGERISDVSERIYRDASVLGLLGAIAAVLAILSVGASPPRPRRPYHGGAAGGPFDYNDAVFERRAGGWTRDRLEAAQDSMVPLIGIAAALLAAQVVMVGATFAWTIPLLTPIEGTPAAAATIPGPETSGVETSGAVSQTLRDGAETTTRSAEQIREAARTAASGLMLYWGGLGTFVLLVAFIAANASLRRGATMIAKAELKKPFSSLRDAAVVSREREMLPTFWPQMRRLLTVFAPLLATPLTQGFTALLDLGAVIAAGS
ncbi:MAG: hypothetical protein GVY27_00500 [Deinococcus-Thermus bacterium]|jgi:hypothetical protein|nr:hypothetical protein [Deinococcota bacterium]